MKKRNPIWFFLEEFTRKFRVILNVNLFLIVLMIFYSKLFILFFFSPLLENQISFYFIKSFLSDLSVVIDTSARSIKYTPISVSAFERIGGDTFIPNVEVNLPLTIFSYGYLKFVFIFVFYFMLPAFTYYFYISVSPFLVRIEKMRLLSLLLSFNSLIIFNFLCFHFIIIPSVLMFFFQHYNEVLFFEFNVEFQILHYLDMYFRLLFVNLFIIIFFLVYFLFLKRYYMENVNFFNIVPFKILLFFVVLFFIPADLYVAILQLLITFFWYLIIHWVSNVFKECKLWFIF